MKLTTHLHLLPSLRMSGFVPPHPVLYAFMAWVGPAVDLHLFVETIGVTIPSTKRFCMPCKFDDFSVGTVLIERNSVICVSKFAVLTTFIVRLASLYLQGLNIFIRPTEGLHKVVHHKLVLFSGSSQLKSLTQDKKDYHVIGYGTVIHCAFNVDS